jgi:kynureninase
MQDASYLRSQAELCLHIARALSDHEAAENLRAVAAQYFVRALEAEPQLAIAESNFVLAQEWRSLMARYFFRANYRGTSVNDDVGEEFSTLQDAEAHAAIVANELVRNSSQAVTVSVLSEDGMLLAKAAAPFR